MVIESTFNDLFQHKLHFLEGVAADAPLAVVEDEVPVVFHLDDGGLKRPLGILVFVEARVAIERSVIARGDLGKLVAFEESEVVIDDLNNLIEQFVLIYFMTENLLERDGVGRIAREAFLVDVDARAKDALRNATTCERRFDERAAELAILPIDVVGPLERDALHIAVEHFLDGHGLNFREQKLAARRHKARVNEQREDDILSGLALPGVRSLSASCRLIVGSHECVLSGLQRAQVLIGGVGFRQMYCFHTDKVKPFCGKYKIKIVLLQHDTDGRTSPEG